MRLEFAVNRSSSTPPARPRADDEVKVWHDNDGVPAAYGFTRGETHWIEYPGVGTFRFAPGSRLVEALAPRTTSMALLRDAYHRAVLPLALHAFGKEVLHASGVLTPHGAVAICAQSETGKSTLAHALRQRGHAPFADDAVVVETVGPNASVSGVPFAIRLRLDSARHFERDADSAEAIEAGDLEVHEQTEPLAALVALERVTETGGPELDSQRLPPAAAFPIILSHAYCFSLREPGRKRLMMQHYLELVAHTPVVRLRFKSGLERLPEILDLIEQAAR